MMVLDIGSGNLPKAPLMWPEAKCICIDMRATDAVQAVADVRHLPFKDGSFDAAISSHVLEHIGRFDTMRAVQEWVRILKDGAEIQIMVPDLEWVAKQILEPASDIKLIHILCVLFGGQEYRGDAHKMGFTKGLLYNIMRSMGLRKVSVKTTAFYLEIIGLPPTYFGALWGRGTKCPSS